MNKKYLWYVAAPAVALVLTGAVGVATVAAATPAKTNPMSNLVAAIAQRFNLNQADVQKVFDDQKSQMRTQMEQTFTDNINQLVTEGKLTQDQANKILAKKAELESQEAAFKASLEGKTKAEVQAAIKAQMDSLKQWATQNNIPLQYLKFAAGMNRGHGRGPK